MALPRARGTPSGLRTYTTSRDTTGCVAGRDGRLLCGRYDVGPGGRLSARATGGSSCSGGCARPRTRCSCSRAPLRQLRRRAVCRPTRRHRWPGRRCGSRDEVSGCLLLRGASCGPSRGSGGADSTADAARGVLHSLRCPGWRRATTRSGCACPPAKTPGAGRAAAPWSPPPRRAAARIRCLWTTRSTSDPPLTSTSIRRRRHARPRRVRSHEPCRAGLDSCGSHCRCRTEHGEYDRRCDPWLGTHVSPLTS